MDTRTFEQFQQGEWGAFEAIVRSMQERLKNYIYRYFQCADAIDDVLQDVWITVWKKRNSARGLDSLQAWLFTIARNRALHLLRQSNRRPQLSLYTEDEMEIELPDHRNHPERALRLKRLREELNAIMHTLRVDEQEIIALRFFAGLRLKEIAEMLGLQYTTATSKMYRALEKLRASMDEDTLQELEIMQDTSQTAMVYQVHAA